VKFVSNFFLIKFFGGRRVRIVRWEKLKAYKNFFSGLVIIAAMIILAGCQSPPNTAFQEKSKLAVKLVLPKVSEPYGVYDATFAEAVIKRWYDFLDSGRFPARDGVVELKFYLHSDGRITDMEVIKNTVGELLGYACERAVKDPAPYAVWPEEMRLKVGKDYREMKFTFHYN
jgi:hypothetical protein